MMVVHLLWRQWSSRPRGRVWHFLAMAITFLSVNLGWAFFCMDLPRAFYALGRVVGLG
jgi:alginate O-acetyltransferase complex protein AlgI